MARMPAKAAKPAPRMVPKRKPSSAIQADDLGIGPLTALPAPTRTPAMNPAPISRRSAPPITGRKATMGTKKPPKMPTMRGR